MTLPPSTRAPDPVRLGIACGLAAAPLWAFAIALCGALRPGFDHLARYISELGERGAETEVLMRWLGFLPAGLLHLGFAAALWALHRSPAARAAALLLALNGLGRIGAGWNPCDPGCAGASTTQALHQGYATLGFLALVAATLAWALHAWRGRRRGRAALALGCAVLAALFLVLMRLDEGAWAGLWERMSSGVLSTGVWLLALDLWRRPGTARG